jgi:hypothetical protein
MMRKSLRTCVLLLGLLVVTSSSAYADTISITTVNVSNVQIVPTSGTIVLLSTSASASGAAVIDFPGFTEESGNLAQSPTRAETSTSVTFASAGGVGDFTNMSLSAFSNVMLSDCLCQAETEGLGGLRASFMVVGGTGNVVVNFSGLLQTVQTLMIDEFSFSAASHARMGLRVFHPDCADVFNTNCGNVNHSFSFDSRLVIRPPDVSTMLEIERQISEAVTLQFGQQYNILISVNAISRGGQNEISEPATLVLLGSGLAFAAGFVRKRR